MPSGGALYEGKTIVPVRYVIAKMAEAAAIPPVAINPLLDALNEAVPIRTPAHQFRLGRGLGNRVVFYGAATINGATVDVGHTHIDRVVTELAKQNLRLIKEMVHFDRPAQGGSPQDIASTRAMHIPS